MSDVKLTAAEETIARFAAYGHREPAIAELMGISYETLSPQVLSVLGKTGCITLAELGSLYTLEEQDAEKLTAKERCRQLRLANFQIRGLQRRIEQLETLFRR